jgi:hypothetical protein
VTVDFVLPKGAKVSKVSVLSPEYTEAAVLKYTVKDGRVQFTLPKFLVYAVARMELAKE